MVSCGFLWFLFGVYAGIIILMVRSWGLALGPPPFAPRSVPINPEAGPRGNRGPGATGGGRGGKEDRGEPKGSEGSRIPSELKGAEGILREPRGTKRNRRGTEVERGDQKGLGEA